MTKRNILKHGDAGRPEKAEIDFNWVFELVNLTNGPDALASPLLCLMRDVIEEISHGGMIKESAALKQLIDIPRERRRIEYEIIGNRLREDIDLDPTLSGIDLLPYIYPSFFIYERIHASGWGESFRGCSPAHRATGENGLSLGTEHG